MEQGTATNVMFRLITIMKVYKNKYRDPAKASMRYYTIVDEFGNKYNIFGKELLGGVKHGEKYQVEFIPSGKYLNVQGILPEALATTQPAPLTTTPITEPHPVLDPTAEEATEGVPDIPFDNTPETEKAEPTFDNKLSSAEKADKEIGLRRGAIVKAICHLYSGQKVLPTAVELAEYCKIFEEEYYGE